MDEETTRLQESADFWRERANRFELALREIEAVKWTNDADRAAERWEIARRALGMPI